MPFILVTPIGLADLGGVIGRGALVLGGVSLVGEVSDEEEFSSELVRKSGCRGPLKSRGCPDPFFLRACWTNCVRSGKLVSHQGGKSLLP